MRIFKRAQATPTISVVAIIFYLVFLALVGSTTVFFVSTYVKTKTDVTETTGMLIAYEALTTKYGITRVDIPTQRNYVTMIDLNKFEDVVLGSSLYLEDNKKFAAKFILKDSGGSTIKEAYVNKAEFVEVRNNIVEERSVQIYDKGKESAGILRISVRMR